MAWRDGGLTFLAGVLAVGWLNAYIKAHPSDREARRDAESIRRHSRVVR